MDIAEIRFLKEVGGFIMTDHKCNEDTTPDLGINVLLVHLYACAGLHTA
jgi:hypothetical protein